MLFTSLRKRRVLVVEDDYLQASDMAAALEVHGSSVVGPFPSVEDGIRAVDDGIEAAILDIRLDNDLVYAVADVLRSRNLPFIFVTGYDDVVPDRFQRVRRVMKPCRPDAAVLTLAVAIAEHRTSH
ncbi:hypothetical protein ASE04_18825 [Rhizobium sp. Root708]|uniref:response regulator n=1 Tax=Rhizobium sp. Root708 TaxID=1736592 RepID=UPI0006F5779C|nr:response regulator [Rhizobium sp. Root708]KRB49227.1 hypothetical protein ASE04_18825 [Rhizobium sp. Root708]